MKYYLYNSLANNGIKPDLPADAQTVDAVGLDYPSFFGGLAPEDEVVLVGGDGTLNYFINALDPAAIKNNVYLLGAGTGNDFLHDIDKQPGERQSYEITAPVPAEASGSGSCFPEITRTSVTF